MFVAVYLRRGVVISDVGRDICIALAMPHVRDDPFRHIFHRSALSLRMKFSFQILDQSRVQTSLTIMYMQCHPKTERDFLATKREQIDVMTTGE